MVCILFQDLNPNTSPTKSSSEAGGNHAAATAALEKKKRRRSSKRVSFSANKLIKEFQVGSQTLTIWNNTYEKETSLASTPAANNGSGAAAPPVNQEETLLHPAAAAPTTEARKRAYPGQSDADMSPSKKMPLEIDILPRGDDPHAFLPWGQGEAGENEEAEEKILAFSGAPVPAASLDFLRDSEHQGEDTTVNLTAGSNNSFLKFISGGQKGKYVHPRT